MASNLAIKPGSEVDYGERRFVIMQVISFEAVVARDIETGELERLPISDLRPISSLTSSVLPPDLAELDDRDWAEARRRLDLIGPVLEKARLPRSVMRRRHETDFLSTLSDGADLLRLLDRFGAGELQAAIEDALAHGALHPNSVRIALERRREARQAPPPGR